MVGKQKHQNNTDSNNRNNQLKLQLLIFLKTIG